MYGNVMLIPIIHAGGLLAANWRTHDLIRDEYANVCLQVFYPVLLIFSAQLKLLGSEHVTSFVLGFLVLCF